MKARFLVLVALSCLHVSPLSAGLITFEGLDLMVLNEGDFFDVNGFRFTLSSNIASGFLDVTNQSSPPASAIIEHGTTKLYVGNHAQLTMTRIDGSLFDLLSLDIGGSWSDPNRFFRWADSVDIIGDFATHNADLSDPTPIYHNQMFSSDFLGISSVLFSPFQHAGAGSNCCGEFVYEFTLDNIEVSSVPEPSTILLLAAGLLTGAVFRKRLQ